MKITETGIGAAAICLTLAGSVLVATWQLSGSLSSIETQLVNIDEQLDKLEDRFNDHLEDHNDE